MTQDMKSLDFGRSVRGWLAVAIACLVPALASAQQGEFYDVLPQEVPGRPGTIIRQEALRPPRGAASAYRILYRSRGLNGEPIAVSGVVALPSAPPPKKGRPIVAWAHGTSGIADHCAPSGEADPFGDVQGLQDFLARGYVVTASDYPGLGTAGVHPYLVGSSEGRAILDSVRAARELPSASAGSSFVVWGYSQGGHAALFAGNLAKAYAPELKLAGIAAAAPPTELGSLIRDDEGTLAGRILASFALRSWSLLYSIPAASFVKGNNGPVLIQLSQLCSMNMHQDVGLALLEQPFERDGFLTVDVGVTQPWRKLLEDNTPGITPSGIPIFIAQGASDAIVRPGVTQLYGDELCRHGIRVHFVLVPSTGHG